VSAVAVFGADSGQVTFKLDFEQSVDPVVGGENLTVDNRDATRVPGAAGQALRVGRKGADRRVVSYTIPETKRAESWTGHIPCPFPLRAAGLSFQFRPVDWEIGEVQAVPLLHIRTDKTGYLSVACRILRGVTQLQVVYGVHDADQAAEGKIPYRYSFVPIVKQPRDHWYDVAVSWGGEGLSLRIDENKKTDIMGPCTFPPRSGWQCEIGSFDSWTVAKPGDGFTDIDNVVIAYTGNAVPRVEGEPDRFPTVRIPGTPNPIVLDGVLNDAAWVQAALLQGMMEIREQEFAAHQPHIFLTYDREDLYIAVKSPLHGKSELLANAVKHDGDVWLDDCVEVFLDPTPETEDFYQFAVNSRGVVVDMGYHVKPGERATRNWDLAGLRTVARVEDDDWILEMAFPFSGFGVPPPKPDAAWLFNLCESRVGFGNFSICEVTRGYAHYERFGRLIYGGPGPSIRVNDFGKLAAGKLALNLSVAELGNADPAQVEVRASQYDETADTHFPVLSRSGTATATPGIVATAQAGELHGHGRLEITAELKSGRLYRGRLNYRVTTDVSLETMRRINSDKGPALQVTTRQPAGGADAGQKLRITILDTTGKEQRHTTKEISGSRMNSLIDLAGLKPGDYGVLVELIDAGGKPLNAEKTRPFTVYPDPPPWRGNGLGISSGVPPPWTPIQAQATGSAVVEVACWNRVVRFGPDSVLPTSIRSGAQELLQQPLRVDLRLGGADCDIRNVSHRLVNQTDQRCHIETRCIAGWGTLLADTTVEFDGFIWTEFELQPTRRAGGGRQRIDRVVVRWDMPLEKSSLINSGFRVLKGTGLTPAEWRRQMDGAFWVGNERGGISCAVESHENWSSTDVHRQALVQRDAKGTHITINMVDDPFDTDARTLRYGIAFLPTPARPRPDGSRKLRECSWMSTKHMHEPYPTNISFWNATPLFMGAPAWAASNDAVKALYKERKRKYVRRVHTYDGLAESGSRSAWYATFSHSARNSPEFIWSGQDWRVGPKDKLYGNTLYGYAMDMVAVCKTPDYVDYWLWRFDNSKREDSLIDGIYLDLMHLQKCAREDHGHGYVDRDGKRQGTVQIREHRKWLLRIYTYLKQQDPKAPVVSHLSGHSAYLMAHSFSDYLWDGELWVREVIRDLSYENLALDTFRAETLDSIYGPHIRWINQLGRALTFLTPAERKTKSLKPYAQRHYYALLLVHDLIPSASDRFQQDTIKLWKLLDRFDLDDSDRLLPYWEKDTGIAVNPPDPNIVATGYAKPDRLLLVVFNNTDRPRDLNVALDPARVFPTAGNARLTWRNAEDEAAPPLGTGAKLATAIGKRDFRLLWVSTTE